MPDRHDETIRRLFEQMRREDAERVPSFAATLAAARRRRDKSQAHGWLRPLPALAAALLVILAGLWLWPGGRQPATSSDAILAASLDDWTAPSTAFLELDNADLLELGGDDYVQDPLDAVDWDLPSDTLLQQAEATLGQEAEL